MTVCVGEAASVFPSSHLVPLFPSFLSPLVAPHSGGTLQCHSKWPSSNFWQHRRGQTGAPLSFSAHVFFFLTDLFSSSVWSFFLFLFVHWLVRFLCSRNRRHLLLLVHHRFRLLSLGCFSLSHNLNHLSITTHFYFWPFYNLCLHLFVSSPRRSLISLLFINKHLNGWNHSAVTNKLALKLLFSPFFATPARLALIWTNKTNMKIFVNNTLEMILFALILSHMIFCFSVPDHSNPLWEENGISFCRRPPDPH